MPCRRSSGSEPQASPAAGASDRAAAGCDARPGLPLVHFNDTCCASVAELRSIIIKARRLADDHAEQEPAVVAVKAWLLARIEKKRHSPSADIADMAPDEPFSFERLAA